MLYNLQRLDRIEDKFRDTRNALHHSSYNASAVPAPPAIELGLHSESFQNSSV
jgi:hypothetical protein